MNKELCFKLLTAEKYFKGTKYSKIVARANRAWDYDGLVECEKELNKLPTEKDLMKALLEKLKGKSVYRTLKKIQENKQLTSFTELKGLSSLLTHVIIECEKSPEYRLLVPSILSELNKVAYDVVW